MDLEGAIFGAVQLGHSDVWQVQRSETIWFMPGLGELSQSTRFLLWEFHQDPIPYSQGWILRTLVVALLVMPLCLLNSSDSLMMTVSSQQQHQLFPIIFNGHRLDWGRR